MPAPSPIRPPALRPGDTVAVVSPSWGGPAEVPAPYRRGLAALEAAGYRVRVMPHAEGRCGWVSGTAEERAADLHQAFADPQLRGIVCTIGGNHSAQLLPLLDVDLVRTHPTVFCGYSDITSLHLAVHAATGLVTFYGPALIPQWGAVSGPHNYVVDHFARVTGRPEPPGPMPRADYEVHGDHERAERTGERIPREPAHPREVLRAGRGSGPLLMACLPSARNLLGTPWQADFAGSVLVLETPEEPYDPETADADLTHLRLAGCLNELAALVLCRPYRFSAVDAAALHDVVMSHVAGRGYPVLARMEGGHTDPLPTYPIGVRATVDGDELNLDEPAVS